MERAFGTHVEPGSSLGAGWSRPVLLVVTAFEALGALIGGPILVVAPDVMKIPLSDLHGVFPSFFVPGLLLTMLGVLNAFAFVAVLRRGASAWLWTGLALVGLLIWFVVELAICGAQSWAQAAWGLPVLPALVAAWPLVGEQLKRR